MAAHHRLAATQADSDSLAGRLAGRPQPRSTRRSSAFLGSTLAIRRRAPTDQTEALAAGGCRDKQAGR